MFYYSLKCCIFRHGNSSPHTHYIILTWQGRYHNQEGGSPRVRLSHCTPVVLTPAPSSDLIFFSEFPQWGIDKDLSYILYTGKKVEGVLQTRCKYSDKHLALKHNIIQNHIHPSLVQNENNADNNQLSLKACIKIFIPNLSVIIPITTFHWHHTGTVSDTYPPSHLIIFISASLVVWKENNDERIFVLHVHPADQ